MADDRDPELDRLLASLGESGTRPLSEISVASSKVAAIVEAAERAAEDLRIKTEEKVRSRIAEADRAVELRVEAAEAEAREIIDAARREAAGAEASAREAVRAIHERAAQAREEAEAARTATLSAASSEAARVRGEAESYAEETRREAREEARAIIAEASAAARGVLEDGSELSGHLNELSDSLRRNAERILNDVKLAHARLTADLDQAAPAGSVDSAPHASRGAPSPAARRRPSDDDFEVPEFLPGRR
jgi:membrane protein involved in colicin uptake